MKIIVAIIPTDLVTNSLLSSFCLFLQESGFQENGGLLNIASCFYFEAMPNSIDFYKGIFSHSITVRIIFS